MEKLKLSKLDLYQLHNAEFRQFIERFFEDFKGASLQADTDADFNKIFEELKALMPNYNKALEQIRESEETKKIAQLDNIRDADIQALRDSIKPYRNAKTEDKKQAYNTIKIVLDEYKKIEKESYEQETAKLNILIATLKDENYQKHLALLKITDFLSELEQSNTAFNGLFAKRSVQNLQKVTYNVKTIRKKITEVYRKLANYIVTMAGIKQDEFYKKVLHTLNNSRKYYADTIAVRGGKKKKEETTDNTPH